MANELRFDGKVVVVTGAGNGLGRSHALAFGARGAKVVVNDLGGSATGEGQSHAAAQKVVDEIKAAGGEAIANFDSVEDGNRIIKTALDAFGRVDVVVNNAGILRDVTMKNITDDQWDIIQKVHVRGAYKTTKAAWNLLREQGYGRIVFTSSAAGIYGNNGQANYSTAKLGLVGLSNTLAIEGRKNNVLVNTIAPLAGSRMTEAVLPPNLHAELKPELVTPLVLWLCHESSTETGGLFEVGGGFFGKLRWERSAGKMFRIGKPVPPEAVRDAWKEIAGFEKTTHPADIMASMTPVMENINAGPGKGGNEFIDVDAALGWQFPVSTSTYTERDLSIYALGVGAAENALDDKELRLVYELHGEGFQPLPTFGVIPGMSVVMNMAKEGVQPPGMNYGLDRILHGEQYLEIHRPLPSHAKLTHKAKIKDIFDKGKNALVVTEIVSTDETGEPLVTNQMTTFVRGAGGWGGDRGQAAEVNVPPSRKPDAVVEEKTHENQALLYRLSGDFNPLHADPAFAKAFGFDKPILHGLCTFGFAARHVIKQCAPNGDPRFFKSIKVRFSDSVYPGDTLVTEMWKESDTRVVFVTKVKGKDKPAISGAAVEFYSELPKPKAKPAVKASAGETVDATPISADVFVGIQEFVAKNPEVVGKVQKTFGFKLTNPDSYWALDLKNDKGSLVKNGPTAVDCTLELSDSDFMAMCSGKADPMTLWSTKKLKISGDLMASQKLNFLQKLDPNLVLEAARTRAGSGAGVTGAGTGDPGTGGASAQSTEFTTADVFAGIKDYVETHAAELTRVGIVYQFALSEPASVWTVDLKNGKVEPGETAKPECTLALSDADFMAMTSGKADPMTLWSTKKLKISGNIMASQKLDFLKKIDPEKARAAALKARGATGGGGAAKPAPAGGAAKEEKKGNLLGLDMPQKAAALADADPKAVFAALSDRFSKNPALAKEVGAQVVFKVTGPDGVWTVDLTGPGSVQEGAPPAGAIPAATFTLSSGDLGALVKGAETAQSLYQHGQLRVDGDVRVAHKLGFLKGLIG